MEWYGDTLPVEKYSAWDMAWVAKLRKIWRERERERESECVCICVVHVVSLAFMFN